MWVVTVVEGLEWRETKVLRRARDSCRREEFALA